MPKSIDVKLDLRDTADFRLVVPDRHIEVVAGTDADYLVNLDRLGSYGNDVILESSGIPSGSSASFSDDELSVGESSVFSINTSGVTPGTYILSTIDAYEAPTIETESYWVSPTGESNWLGAKKDTPLSGTDCCSIATANANASAGDTVYLREGTYSSGITPAHSGTSGSRITFSAYGSETPMFTVNTANGSWPIKLIGKSYIKISGISSYESDGFFFIGYGSSYNEITNCDFDKSTYFYSFGLISWYNTAFSTGGASNHNWIHDCTFSHYGDIGDCDDYGTVRISGGGNDPSVNNTFEDCVFSYGGHDCVDIGGRYNVIKGNVFHNEESYYPDTTGTCTNSPTSGYFGNRCVLLSNEGDKLTTAYHTLIEGNRIGHSGCPPDDDGSFGIENAGCHTLIRGNYVYNTAGSGIYFKAQPAPSPGVVLKSGSWGRVYNNTVYHSGYGDADISSGFKNGVQVIGITIPEYYPWPEDVYFKNNIVYDYFSSEYDFFTEASTTECYYTNNYNGDPGFIDDDLSDPTSLVLPNLGLQSNSPCINNGASLTLANGSGSSSATLTVDDAYYFQDGTWGSSLAGHQADWIAVGTVGNVAQISSINYDTKVITLASPLTWSDDADIWLYKNSSGTRVLYGSAPDQGAYQYTA